MRPLVSLSTLGLSCVLVAAGQAAAQTYNVTDLGLLPGTQFSNATAINQSGDIIGFSGDYLGGLPLGPRYSFLYRDGKLVQFSYPGESIISAAGITGGEGKGPWDGDEGKRKLRITGFAEFGESETHAILYQDHLLRDLGLLPGGHQSMGNGVNSSGEVAGVADNADYVQLPMLYKHGNMMSLEGLGGTGGIGRGINDWGDVTGQEYLPGGDFHAFLYRDGKMIDLGTLPGEALSSGTAINNSVEITGVSYSADYSFQHAFLWSKGKMIDLGVLPTGTISQGNGINSWGQVVGGGDFGLYSEHAFLYHHGQLHDLNDMIPSSSGWVLLTANGINDHGEIVGTGNINGETHGFLLTLDCGNSKNKDCEPCR